MCLAVVVLPCYDNCYGIKGGEYFQSHWVDLCTGHSYLLETLSLGLILIKGQVSKVNLYSKLKRATALEGVTWLVAAKPPAQWVLPRAVELGDEYHSDVSDLRSSARVHISP